MAEITAKLVKELREKSGAGVMDAKKALVEVEGDIEKAIELLREKGMAKAAKKADRVAAEGLTGVYVNGNVAAVVEVNAETDFVAKNAQFVELVNETAKVIAEGKPANNEEALALTMPSGETLEAAYVTATATIGEKIHSVVLQLLRKLMRNTSELTNTTVDVSVLFQLSKVEMMLLQNKSQCTSQR